MPSDDDPVRLSWTEADLRRVRESAAERGREYTPDEVREAADILAEVSRLVTPAAYASFARMTAADVAADAAALGLSPEQVRDFRDLSMYVYELAHFGRAKAARRHPLADEEEPEEENP